MSRRSTITKYVQLFSVSWQNGLVYRASVLMWRVRQLLSTVMALTIWQVVFKNSSIQLNYSADQMLTYIFLIALLQSLILGTVLHGLSGTIYSGSLSKELVKPVNIFLYLGMQDVADKLKNFLFVVGESTVLFYIFQPQLPMPSLSTLVIFILWVGLGALLYFWISLLFGAIGFWSPDTWGPKFLFLTILNSIAGQLFPLDILPKFVQKIIFATPFPFLSYVQIQLFLNRLSPEQFWWSWAGLLGWCTILGWLTYWVWQRGLLNYSAAGQ